MIFLLIVAIFIIFVYLYNTSTFNYWKARGIKYEEPVFFFGTYKTVFLQKESRSQLGEKLYFKYPNEKVVGGFKSTTPELCIRDPELIKTVLVSDFSSFFYRSYNYFVDEKEPLRNGLFGAEGDLWRMLRHRMTPAFTSGKLKSMFPLIVERAEKLQSRALAAAKSNSTTDIRELMACYTTDFIGACGFGVDADSLNDENSTFRKIGRDTFTITRKEAIIRVLKDAFPRISKPFKVFGKVEGAIFSLVRQIIEQRNYQPIGRNDFVDLMLEHYNKPMHTESIEKTKPDGNVLTVERVFDEGLFAAQIFVFFSAGFETSSSSTSYTLHELAYHPEVQKKVQTEIDEVLARHNNKLSYEAVKEMQYLEWTFKEGLRKFPSLGYLMRKCSKKYTFKDINLSIDEGVHIIIPVQGLHMDPKYWDEPDQFRPERFSPENFTATQKMVYFPFGEGPRNCIGSRLGLMQSMAGLAAVLAKFTVEPAPETRRIPIIDPRSNVVQGMKYGIPLLIKERQNFFSRNDTTQQY